MRLITQYKFLIYLYTYIYVYILYTRIYEYIHVYMLLHICRILIIIKYYICKYTFSKNLNNIYYML